MIPQLSDINIKLNLETFFNLWFLILSLGSTSILLGKSLLSGHFSSSNGKYFEAKVVEKTREILPTEVCFPSSASLLRTVQFFRFNDRPTFYQVLHSQKDTFFNPSIAIRFQKAARMEKNL